jgi:hypothetical protein
MKAIREAQLLNGIRCFLLAPGLYFLGLAGPVRLLTAHVDPEQRDQADLDVDSLLRPFAVSFMTPDGRATMGVDVRDFARFSARLLRHLPRGAIRHRDGGDDRKERPGHDRHARSERGRGDRADALRASELRGQRDG